MNPLNEPYQQQQQQPNVYQQSPYNPPPPQPVYGTAQSYGLQPPNPGMNPNYQQNSYQGQYEQPSYSGGNPFNENNQGSSSGIPANYNSSIEPKFTPQPKYQDPIFAVLWVLSVVATIIIFVVSLAIHNSDHDPENPDNKILFFPNSLTPKLLAQIVFVLIINLSVAITLAILFLVVLKFFPKQLIYISLTFSVILSLLLGIYLLFQAYIFMGVLLCASAILSAFLFFLWRSRIPFASLMLNLISTLITRFPGTLAFSAFTLVIQILWLFFLLFTLTLTFQYPPIAFYPLGIFLLLSLYWTGQVIKNTLHVTVSGTFSMWYFTQNSSAGLPANPTLGAYKRASTTSLGSICLGSLIVAILRTLRMMAHWFRTQESDNWVFVILAFIAECILGCIEGLVEYFNAYAFAQIAIYGKSYISAAKDTWRLIKSHGIEAIINDDIIGNVTGLLGLLSGVVVGIVSGVVSYLQFKDESGLWIGMLIAGFIIGLLVVGTVMEVVESGVIAIFVCFAEDPEALRKGDQRLYDKMRETYGSVAIFAEEGH